MSTFAGSVASSACSVADSALSSNEQAVEKLRALREHVSLELDEVLLQLGDAEAFIVGYIADSDDSDDIAIISKDISLFPIHFPFCSFFNT